MSREIARPRSDESHASSFGKMPSKAAVHPSPRFGKQEQSTLMLRETSNALMNMTLSKAGRVETSPGVGREAKCQLGERNMDEDVRDISDDRKSNVPNGDSLPFYKRNRKERTNQHALFSKSFNGSLLDAEVSMEIEDGDLTDTDTMVKARYGRQDSSPTPAGVESTSGSSVSSKDSEASEDTTSIFRDESSRPRSRIQSQELGTNSILSPTRSNLETDNQDDTDNGLSVPFTRLHRIPYVHGSYSTAAPIMLHDTKWMRILRRLMPESHADAVTILCQERHSRGSQFPNAVRIMKYAENNPVVAAYGILTDTKLPRRRSSVSPKNTRFSWRTRRGSSTRSVNSSQRPPALEWDVFLDPNLVQKVEKALTDAGEVERNDVEGQIAADVEVDRQVGRLISRMMLAHGSTSQLVAEAMGFTPRHNFASVVEQGESQRLHRRSHRSESKDKTPASRGLIDVWKAAESQGFSLPLAHELVAPIAPGKGRAKGAGIFVERWMAVFAAALQLGAEGDGMEATSSLNEYGKLVETLEEEVEIRQEQPRMCGMFLCLGYEDPNSAKADHSKTSMAESAQEIQNVLGSPLRLVLDLKSRRVPPRVWSRLVDTLRSRGVEVEGLGSFDIEELRSIESFSRAPVTGLIFFHSAGDLQRACHANEVKRGDTVYFNAGSLIMPKPSLVAKLNCCQSEQYVIDGYIEQEEAVVFQPFAYPRGALPGFFDDLTCRSTVEDYQRRFDLRIGVYVQEFSISDRIIDAIARFVNDHKSIYNLGLAWGGVNGKTSPLVPGDGYWNQRYMGRTWDPNAEPSDAMHLLHIEDHHLVKKAMRAGAWGHIGMVNPVNDVGGDATGEGAAINFETCRPIE